MQRRHFVKNSITAGALGVVGGSALLTTPPLRADHHKNTLDAFKASSLEEALATLDIKPEASEAINIRAPEIAENGAVVPITVSTTLKDASRITLLVSNNPMPMAAQFDFMENSGEITASTRLKMGETSDLVAVVTAGEKTYMAKQEIKVTIGGCGG